MSDSVNLLRGAAASGRIKSLHSLKDKSFYFIGCLTGLPSILPEHVRIEVKRFTPLTCLILVFSVFVAACGDNMATTAPAATTAASTTAAVTAGAATTSATTSAATTATGVTATAGDLSYTDMTGFKGTLPKPAERIVCMWTDCFDMITELGIEPLAVNVSVYKILLASADSYPIVDKNKT